MSTDDCNMLDAMRDTDIPTSELVTATVPTTDQPQSGPGENRSTSLEDLLAPYSEIKVTRPNVPVPFIPPEDPEECPIFLPVRSRNLCWRCGREGHHRSTCLRPPILFCSRCGGLNRLSRSCRCQFAEEERRMLPPPRIVPGRDRFVSRGIQCELGRESFRFRFPREDQNSRRRTGCPRRVHWATPVRRSSPGGGADGKGRDCE